LIEFRKRFKVQVEFEVVKAVSGAAEFAGSDARLFLNVGLRALRSQTIRLETRMSVTSMPQLTPDGFD
jgi:hypothetical protein